MTIRRFLSAAILAVAVMGRINSAGKAGELRTPSPKLSYDYPVRVDYAYAGRPGSELCRADFSSLRPFSKNACWSSWNRADLERRHDAGSIFIGADGTVTFRGPDSPAACFLLRKAEEITSITAEGWMVPLVLHFCTKDGVDYCKARRSGHPAFAAAVMRYIAIPSCLKITRIEEGVGR